MIFFYSSNSTYSFNNLFLGTICLLLSIISLSSPQTNPRAHSPDYIRQGQVVHHWTKPRRRWRCRSILLQHVTLIHWRHLDTGSSGRLESVDKSLLPPSMLLSTVQTKGIGGINLITVDKGPHHPPRSKTLHLTVCQSRGLHLWLGGTPHQDLKDTTLQKSEMKGYLIKFVRQLYHIFDPAFYITIIILLIT